MKKCLGLLFILSMPFFFSSIVIDIPLKIEFKYTKIEEELEEDMEYLNYTDLNITSSKFPINNNLWWEHSTYGLILVDYDDRTKLFISTDKGDNWSEIDLSDNTNSYKIQAGWLDGNDLWLLMCDNDGTADDFEVCYVELDDSNDCNPVGVSTGATLNTVYAYDIFKIGANMRVINLEDRVGFPELTIVVWNVTSAPFTELDNQGGTSLEELTLGGGLVVGNIYYFNYQYDDAGTKKVRFSEFNDDTDTIGKYGGLDAYELPSKESQHGISYDDVDIMYFVLRKSADGLIYLIHYSISGGIMTDLGALEVILMTNRNTASGVKEKAFHKTENKIYQIQENSQQLHLLATPETSVPFSAITDNFLMDSNGKMFEYIDQTSNMASFLINHPIMDAPTAKTKIKKSSVVIERGMYLTIMDDYTSQSDSNNAIIFEGKVIDFDDKLLQSVWLESQALKELDNIFPEGSYSGSSQSIINALITTYCKYVSVGTLAAGQAMGSITYAGDKSLRNVLLTLIYINNFIWYLTPTGALNFNSGVIDSGVNLTETNNVWKVRTGNQGEGFNYWKIRGALVNGVQLEKVLQDAGDQLLNGLNPLSETYAELNSQSLVNIMAAARQTRTQDVSKIVNYLHYDASLGFIQPGETKTFEYGYSEPVVAQDQFIIYGIKYDARGGIGDYKIADEPL